MSNVVKPCLDYMMSSCGCNVVDRTSFMSPVHSVLWWVDVLVVCHMSSLQYRKIWHTVSLQYALISCLSSYCYYLSSTFQSWAQFLSFITPSAAILPPPHPPAPHPPQQPGWYGPRQKINGIPQREGRKREKGGEQPCIKLFFKWWQWSVWRSLWGRRDK